MTVHYSVIIPVKDEAENIEALIEEIEEVMEPLALMQKQPWEMIVVEDGSTDDSPKILRRLSEKKSYLRVLFFSKNFGQSSAFDAGFRAAKGSFVISLDGDGQNAPSDIPRLLEHTQKADLICGWRKDRKDPISKKITSKFANFVRSRLCKDGIHDTGCSLKVYRRACLEKIKLFQGMHRFLPALFVMEGFRVFEVPVQHRPRMAGKSKYHFFNRFLGPISDLLAIIWMRRRTLSYNIEQEIP